MARPHAIDDTLSLGRRQIDSSVREDRLILIEQVWPVNPASSQELRRAGAGGNSTVSRQFGAGDRAIPG